LITVIDPSSPESENQTIDPGVDEGPGGLEYAFWSFVLIAVGRIGELIPGLANLPIAKVTLGIALIFLVKNWKLLPKRTSGIRNLVRTCVWLVVLCVVLTPFSIWPGASRQFLFLQLPVLITITAIAYTMGRSWRVTRGTLLVLVISGVALARAALAAYTGGRIEADTMYDTNDLAYVLVTVFPISIAFWITAQTSLKRLAYLGAGGVILGTLLLTQSRGGFLGLVCTVVLGALVGMKKVDPGKSKRRVLSLIGVAALGIVIFSQLPLEARTRFATILDLGNDYNLDPNNDKSRGQIWSRGIAAAAQRPWGYGPESFGMVDYLRGGRMMAPHNSYVEAVVELGIVGLILFLRMYVLSWKGLQGARNRLIAYQSESGNRQEQIIFARALQLSLVGNAIAGFFLSMAYVSILWLDFGLCMALIAIADRSNEFSQ
jgi:O-antigen ligase